MARGYRLITLVALAQVAGLLWFGAPAAQAATDRVWTGACDSAGCDALSWAEPGNWSPVGVPQSGDAVTVALPQTVHGPPASLTLASLRVGAGAALVADPGPTPVLAAGTLTLQCASVTGVHLVSAAITSTGAVVRAGSVTSGAGGTLGVSAPDPMDPGCAAAENPGGAAVAGVVDVGGAAIVSLGDARLGSEVTVGAGARLRIGGAARLQGSSTIAGPGEVVLGSDAGPLAVVVTGAHRLSADTRLTTRGLLTFAGSSTSITTVGPTEIGGIVRVHPGARLRVGGDAVLTAERLDSGSCCAVRGSLEVLPGATLRVGEAAQPLIRFLAVDVAGRLWLGGRTLRLDRATLTVARSGVLLGPGTLGGSAAVAGTVSFTARGALAVAGSLRLSPSATVRLTVGSTPARSDRVAVTGALTVAGRVVLRSSEPVARALALVWGATRSGEFTAAAGVPPGRRVLVKPRSVALGMSDLLPDLTLLGAEDLYLASEGSRRRLRFTTIIANVGAGEFVLRGHRRCLSLTVCPLMGVRQEYQQWDGTSRTEPTAARMEFEVGDGHQHWHVVGMERFELFDLRKPNGGRALKGHKFGYCFFDVRGHRLDLPGASESEQYSSENCGSPYDLSNRMGLSVGWGDVYPSYVAGQWIDVTGVPDGDYLLCLTADPRGQFTEASEANNQSWQRVRIRGWDVQVVAAAIGSCAARLPRA